MQQVASYRCCTVGIIAAAFGVIIRAWNALWDGAASAIPLPFRAVVYGSWLTR